MIKRLQIESETKNAFEISEVVVKETQLVRDLQKDGTPEGVSKVENVQELLNGIKDFITDKIETGEDASLTSFLEDVALATDFDADGKDDTPRVALMSIHQSKGLEFPYVYIVGLEENLFPSAMSMNTRSELEEERRLFYVALTRAEKQAYLSYAQTRYRWGKLTDGEPSRFLEEIDEQYLEYLTPKAPKPSANRFIDADIFGDAPKQIRYQKPIQKKRKEFEKKKSANEALIAKGKLKKISDTSGSTNMNLFSGEIVKGNLVEHNRFGVGTVLSLEGKGPNKKAEIQFGTVGTKKLLLQFAKLKVIG